MSQQMSLVEGISFKGKRVLITGSAAGIGRAIARRFAEAGPGRRIGRVHTVPAHVRHRQAHAVGEPRDARRDDAETGRVAFLAGLEQQLHAETDAEHGLAQRADHVDEAERPQACHGVRGRTDPRQDHARCAKQGVGVPRELRTRAETVERESQRGDVGTAVVDDGDLGHGGD